MFFKKVSSLVDVVFYVKSSPVCTIAMGTINCPLFLCSGEAIQLDLALFVLKVLKQIGTMPNQISYSILLKACEK